VVLVLQGRRGRCLLTVDGPQLGEHEGVEEGAHVQHRRLDAAPTPKEQKRAYGDGSLLTFVIFGLFIYIIVGVGRAFDSQLKGSRFNSKCLQPTCRHPREKTPYLRLQ